MAALLCSNAKNIPGNNFQQQVHLLSDPNQTYNHESGKQQNFFVTTKHEQLWIKIVTLRIIILNFKWINYIEKYKLDYKETYKSARIIKS